MHCIGIFFFAREECNDLFVIFNKGTLQIPNSLEDKLSHWDSQNETLITHYGNKNQEPR